MSNLKDLQCEECKAGSPLVSEEVIEEYICSIPDWNIETVEGMKHLVRSFPLKNFKEALDFTIKIGEIAEEVNHHPQIITEWGKVTVSWWTHKIGGLHLNDFIMAARTDALLEG